MLRIDAVIINFHQPELTGRAVHSVLASRDVEPRVFVIDNEGDGGWARAAFADDPRVEVVANARNLGFGAACNQGIERALAGEAHAVLLLNNDATIEPDTASRLAAAAERTGLAAPKILLPDGRLYAAGGIVELNRARCRNRGIYQQDRGQFDLPETMTFASACALMISRRALESGARFHEPFFLYYEDADLCLNFAARGFSVAYEPAARAWHLESASTGAADTPRLHYYDARNRLLLLERHAKPTTRLPATAYLLAVKLARAARLLLGGRGAAARATLAGLRDYYAGRLGPMPARGAPRC